jgi:2'-5' RNA ligase
MPRTRTFIAIDVSSDIRAAAVALQQSLAKSAVDVNWAAAESMHVTLLFLGEVDDRELHAVCRAVKDVAATELAFPLRVSGVGAFPTLRRPKILWAGITEGAVQLKRLYDKLEGKLFELGCYRKEERGYTPHLTLGRVKGDAESFALARDLPKHRDWEGGRTMVDEIHVFSSVREREGPVYTVIGRGELAGP